MRFMVDLETRAEILRRRITLYRDYLKQGVASELASQYLREIVAAERELDRMSADKKRSPSS